MFSTPRTILRRCYSLSASFAQCKAHPEYFNGVYTRFGWVLVPKTHIARGWTQPRLNKYLEQEMGKKNKDEPVDLDKVQVLVDKWASTVDLHGKPSIKKKSAAEVRYEENLKLFLQQLREEVKDGDKRTQRSARLKKIVTSGDITFTHAWNYFMAKLYPKYSDLSEADARAKVGLTWRLMSMDEKDVYREEYSELLQLGKDIYRGKIVDREVKMKAVERLNLSKERIMAKKLKKLEETQRELENPEDN